MRVSKSDSVGAGEKVGGFALRVVVDTREKLPLVFSHLPSVRGTLYTGDYSVKGFENSFTVERKSAADLVQSLTHGRERFMRELDRMRGYEFARLCVIGSIDEALDKRHVKRASVFGSLAAIDARGVPVVCFRSPEEAALQVESWAWFFFAKRVQGVSGKSATAPQWARVAMESRCVVNVGCDCVPF